MSATDTSKLRARAARARLSWIAAAGLSLGSLLTEPALLPQVANAATTTYTVITIPSLDKRLTQGQTNEGTAINSPGHVVGAGE